MASSSETLTTRVLSAVNDQDLEQMLSKQAEIQTTFYTTTANLVAFNDFSAARYNDLHRKFESHARLVRDMKADLDVVFRKIRSLKAQLIAKHPEAYGKVLEKYPPRPEDNDEEE
ncbi:hypothetical protein BC937DRAFT_91397 [Endogone sp. FLAS-F59071]|nr:hypothetical protein BC937DRAFT_91397 [Endogone sp. FLAS-F59071]|eukprot:RUS21805.1 hypothetical protein BC937DRAFT_91397 [Endogone sp. FLAS-F59071]